MCRAVIGTSVVNTEIYNTVMGKNGQVFNVDIFGTRHKHHGSTRYWEGTTERFTKHLKKVLHQSGEILSISWEKWSQCTKVMCWIGMRLSLSILRVSMYHQYKLQSYLPSTRMEAKNRVLTQILCASNKRAKVTENGVCSFGTELCTEPKIVLDCLRHQLNLLDNI